MSSKSKIANSGTPCGTCDIRIETPKDAGKHKCVPTKTVEQKVNDNTKQQYQYGFRK
jgi:hypothetical protein